MLRKNSQERFLKLLSERSLTEHSFEVIFSSTTSEMMKVLYRHHPDFFFKLSADTDNDGTFWVSRCPGEELLSAEGVDCPTLHAAVSAFSEWLRFVEVEDQIPDGSESEIADLKKLFFRELARHVKDEDKHFSSEEADALKQRLSKLEELLEETMTRQKKTEAEIAAFKKRFKESARDIDTMTKKKWLYAGGGKILNAMLSIVKSRESRKALIDGVQRMLQ